MAFFEKFFIFSGRIAKDSNEYTNPAESSGFSAFPMHKQRQPEGRYDGASELMHYRALEDHPLESKVRDKVLVAIPIQKSSERGEINSRPLGRLDSPVNRLRGYTFFQSTSFKKRLAQHPLDKKNAACPMEDYSAPKKRTGAIISRKRLPFLGGPTGTNRLLAPQASQASKSSKKKFRPKGCLFFFDIRSHTVFETHQKSLASLELVNKIESLELNNNLILLFGQMKSTVVNHVDLKEASILNIITTHQQFFSQCIR